MNRNFEKKKKKKKVKKGYLSKGFYKTMDLIKFSHESSKLILQQKKIIYCSL